MNMLLNLESPVTTAHRAKLAYIYVRQSTAGQVRQHQESTELQYRLVDRAVLFGWPKERVEVIDDDLGKSAVSSDDRYGFQRLIAEIGLGKAGLVLSLDASRLARNNRDWHQLLELCSLFGVLIADGERLYDPCAYHDRLLLGLSGIMSEAELHQIKVRLHLGERQKAARGELRMPLPAGLCPGRDGRVVLNPDEEIQARLLRLFATFRKQKQQPGLYLLVRIENHPAVAAMAKTRGQWHAQLAPGRLLALAQMEANLDLVQLRFAHDAGQAEQQTVVIGAGVVEPLAVGNQDAEQRAGIAVRCSPGAGGLVRRWTAARRCRPASLDATS